MRNGRRRAWYVGALAVAALALALAGGGSLFSRTAHALGIHRAHLLGVGDRLTPLQLSGIDGAPITLAPTAGKPRIINVFATWCTECKAEMADVVSAAPKIQRRGVQFIGIDQLENGPAVAGFAQTYGLHYPIYIDSSGVSHYVLGARYIPTTIAIDASGVIRAVHVGPMTSAQFLQLAQQVSANG